MEVNKEYIKELLEKKKWSQNNFAFRCGVAKSTVSRWLHGKRGAGKSLIRGIMKAFPEEPVEKLFVLGEDE